MPIARSVEERFQERVIKHGPDECWEWRGALSHGYPVLGVGSKIDNTRRPKKASQIAWEIENQESFPVGMMACHHCDNPTCVNAKHIYPGTHKTNSEDMYRRNRANRPPLKTHCPNGHEYVEGNHYIYLNKSGYEFKMCKECSLDRQRKRRSDEFWRSK